MKAKAYFKIKHYKHFIFKKKKKIPSNVILLDQNKLNFVNLIIL